MRSPLVSSYNSSHYKCPLWRATMIMVTLNMQDSACECTTAKVLRGIGFVGVLIGAAFNGAARGVRDSYDEAQEGGMCPVACAQCPCACLPNLVHIAAELSMHKQLQMCCFFSQNLAMLAHALWAAPYLARTHVHFFCIARKLRASTSQTLAWGSCGRYRETR